MPFTHVFVTTQADAPFWPVVLTTLQQNDASVFFAEPTRGLNATIGKDSAWTPAQIAFAQNAIDAAPRDTPQLRAQFSVDAMPLFQKAIVLTLLDLINEGRAAGSKPLPAITPGQLLAAVRTKAGSLS